MIGHSLGLMHSQVSGSIMNAFYSNQNNRVILSDDDVRGIQDIYGMLFFILTYSPWRSENVNAIIIIIIIIVIIEMAVLLAVARSSLLIPCVSSLLLHLLLVNALFSCPFPSPSFLSFPFPFFNTVFFSFFYFSLMFLSLFRFVSFLELSVSFLLFATVRLSCLLNGFFYSLWR